MMGLAIMLCAWLQATEHVGYGLAIVLTLLAGVIVGSINAFVVVRLGVDSFIATLGASSILIGLVEWISNGNQIVEGISPKFLNISGNQIFSISLPVFYMVIIAGVLWYVVEYRQFGRYMYATGSNPDAARLAGVRTDRLRAFSLVISATIASLAGIIFLSKIGSASPDSSTSYLLPAFAGVLLGATQVKPGRVNVPGTLIAVYLLATGIEGLELDGAQIWVQDVFNGCRPDHRSSVRGPRRTATARLNASSPLHPRLIARACWPTGSEDGGRNRSLRTCRSPSRPPARCW